MLTAECRMLIAASHPHDHHFRGLDQRRGFVAALQAHLARGIGGDDRRDVLPADGHLHLGHQSLDADFHDAAHQLVAAADAAEIGAGLSRLFAQRLVEEAVDLALRDAMVAADRLHRAQLALVDPLLQAGIADAQDYGGIARAKQLL